jgi:hypothetical protein
MAAVEIPIIVAALVPLARSAAVSAHKFLLARRLESGESDRIAITLPDGERIEISVDNSADIERLTAALGREVADETAKKKGGKRHDERPSDDPIEPVG